MFEDVFGYVKINLEVSKVHSIAYKIFLSIESLHSNYLCMAWYDSHCCWHFPGKTTLYWRAKLQRRTLSLASLQRALSRHDLAISFDMTSLLSGLGCWIKLSSHQVNYVSDKRPCSKVPFNIFTEVDYAIPHILPHASTATSQVWSSSMLNMTTRLQDCPEVVYGHMVQIKMDNKTLPPPRYLRVPTKRRKIKLRRAKMTPKAPPRNKPRDSNMQPVPPHLREPSRAEPCLM